MEESRNLTVAESVSLRDYMDSQFAHITELVKTSHSYTDIKFAAIEKAVILANAANEKRLDSVNEFRSQLDDQAKTFITRSELNAMLSGITSDIKILRDSSHTFIGRQEHDNMLTRIDANIAELQKSKAFLEGKASQSSVNIAMLMSAMGLLTAILSLLLRFAGF